MKIKNLLPLVALCSPVVAMAVPATPEVLTKTNPDGTKVEIRLVGDEHFNYVTDKDGVFILEKNAQGFWTKAVRNGAELMNVEADIQRLRESRMVEDFQIEANNKDIPSWDSDLRTTFPTVGQGVRSLVILLEFPDIPFTMDDPVEFYTRYLNEENFKHEDLEHSARDFFLAASDGKFDPHFDVKYFKLPFPHENYAKSYSMAFYSALTGLADEINYSNYDFDDDGVVDTVYFIYSGYGQADTSDETCIWPHQGRLRKLNLVLNGKNFDNYACSNSLRGGVHYVDKDNAIAGMGSFCHEFSHVLGLPDLYDTSDSGTSEASQSTWGPCEWSLMDIGPYNNDGRTPPIYSAFELRALNWLDEFTMPEEDGQYSIKPFSEEKTGMKITLVNQTGQGNLKNEYYIIENRDRKGFDAYLPGEGVIIWHVDYDRSIWSSNKVNNDESRPRLTLLRPKGKEVSISNSAFPYTDESSGAFYDYVGAGYEQAFDSRVNQRFPTEKYITNIKIGEDGAATFNYFTSAPYSGKVEYIKDFVDESEEGLYGITWPAVPDADGYIVTVKRKGASRDYIINSGDGKLDGKRITGNTVTYSLTSGMIKQTFNVSVRPYKDNIPSVEETVHSYIPNESAAVESIGSDATDAEIYGAEGRIEAPADAQIFNISGISVRNENLPAGIYIVNYRGRTAKVMVK